MKKDITALTEADRIRLVVSDLDGTLLNEKKEISARALAAVADLRRHGVLFTVCTGREYAMLGHYARQLQPTAPMVCNNGGEVVCYPSGEVIMRTLLPQKESLCFLHFCIGHGIDFCVTTPTAAFFPKGSGMTGFYEEYQTQAGREGLEAFPIHILEEPSVLKSLDINKIIIRTDLTESQKAVDFLRRELPAFETTMSSRYILEILPRGMNKAQGLKALCRHLQIPLSQVCAVGDYDNDMELLALAGFAVAMANARDAVRETAGYLTRSNEEDGVALLLETIVQKRGAAEKEA